MPNITVTITDTEEKCLNTVMVGIGTWTDNLVTDRARIAKDEIISTTSSIEVHIITRSTVY